MKHIISVSVFLEKWAECYYWINDNEVSIVGPGSQLHAAVLEVKREMQHNDFTVAFEDGRWVPRDHARVLQQHLGLVDDGKVTIGTENSERHSINISAPNVSA